MQLVTVPQCEKMKKVTNIFCMATSATVLPAIRYDRMFHRLMGGINKHQSRVVMFATMSFFLVAEEQTIGSLCGLLNVATVNIILSVN